MNPVAIVLSPLALCGSPVDSCAHRTYRTSSWGGCKNEPKGCYLQEFEMSLPKGDPIEVIDSDTSGKWLRVVARWCTSDCTKTFSGWLKRSDVAYLSEFKPTTSWPSESTFLIEIGDYADQFKVQKDGSFRTYDQHGSMFFFRDIVWARLKKKPNSTEFIFIPVEAEGKYCWSINPGEEKDRCWAAWFLPWYMRLP